MEQLAEIVLNGEGGRLLGLKSKEPEIQAFLNNVPSYMVCNSSPSLFSHLTLLSAFLPLFPLSLLCMSNCPLIAVLARLQEKIHRVHDAARDGSLLALQQALDRRKFAIAKDDISPNGATPLHVAVLFGHSGKLRGVTLSTWLCHSFLHASYPIPRYCTLFGFTLSGDDGNYG